MYTFVWRLSCYVLMRKAFLSTIYYCNSRNTQTRNKNLRHYYCFHHCEYIFFHRFSWGPKTFQHLQNLMKLSDVYNENGQKINHENFSQEKKHRNGEHIALFIVVYCVVYYFIYRKIYTLSK